jgi:hypothetical protein
MSNETKNTRTIWIPAGCLAIAALAAASTARASELQALDSSWSPQAVAPAVRPDDRLLPLGSYRAEMKDGREVTLMLRDVPGRAQSALAVLMLEDFARVAIYLVDPLDDTSYTLKPVYALADGEIGVPNDDPSLVIQIGPRKGRRITFTLSNANSSNTRGFQGLLRFEGDTSKHAWGDYEDGEYGAGRFSAILSPRGGDGSGKAVLDLGTAAAGNFALREKAPGVFTLKPYVVSSTGVSVSTAPRRLGIFVRFGRRRQFVLVDPTNDQSVVRLKRR